MQRNVALGIQSFPKLRENNYFYIDKTHFIKEWWERGDDITLITRPRRFGKTLMLDMVKTFFSPEYYGRSSLFEGLYIWNEDSNDFYLVKINIELSKILIMKNIIILEFRKL